jgi:hypothetical protein
VKHKAVSIIAVKVRFGPNPAADADQANVGKVPHFTSSCAAQRTAMLPEPATRDRRGEGSKRAHRGRAKFMLRAHAARKLAATLQNRCCIAEENAVIQAMLGHQLKKSQVNSNHSLQALF